MNTRFLIAVTLTLTLASAFGAGNYKTLYHYTAYEAAFWSKNLPIKGENYSKCCDRDRLDQIPNAPAHFDALLFAPTFGFGSMAGDLKSSDPMTQAPNKESAWLNNYVNAMPKLVSMGTDPIAETLKWCRAQKMDCIVSLPVNILGTHSNKAKDSSRIGYWECYLWPKFKTANPDTLMGSEGKSPYANGNAVDYGHAKVRDKFAAIACEIVSKYDVDGVMIDFCDSPTLFRSVAAGGVAEAKELAALTEMMKKIQAACKSRGKPCKFAARVPDSLGYCKDIGIDLAGWLEAKMFDFVLLGGTFQLNTWQADGEMMAKYNVPWYASFTLSGIYVGNDSGYTGDDERIPRQAAATYRARIADALRAKAAGCCYTQGQHHDHHISHSQMVPYDAAANRLGDKRYFVCYTDDGAAGRTLKDGTKHRTCESLVSTRPIDLSKGGGKFHVNVWDDFAALKREGIEPTVTLVTEVSIPSGVSTIVHFNGKEVKDYKKRSGTQLYKIPLAMVKTGANEITVKAKGANKRHQIPMLGNLSIEVTFPKAGGKK